MKLTCTQLNANFKNNEYTHTLAKLVIMSLKIVLKFITFLKFLDFYNSFSKF